MITYLGPVWSLDWGNVPAWLGAVSLLLAFRIFLRDRGTRQRAQVEKVGVWWKIERELSPLEGPRVDDAKIRTYVRNASDLPIEASLIAWTIHTRWGVPAPQPGWPTDDPAYPGVWSIDKGKPDTMRFIGPIEISPQTTWKSQWVAVNLTHTAPENAAWLDFTSEGMRCAISYALITDNAGRRWETRHQQGRQAKRIHWYSRSGINYPPEWQNPIGRRVRVLKARMIEKRKKAHD